MRDLVCFSGPHGGGKTYLIDQLVREPVFKVPTFEIDFLSEFTSFAQLRDWERSLLRLYHRVFISSLTVDREPGRCVLVSRGPLDSAAYIQAYHRLGWISEREHKILQTIIEVIPAWPSTVMLLPDPELNEARLHSRIDQGVRSVRDTVFTREDQPEFLRALYTAFTELADRAEVLVIRDNQAEQIAEVTTWILEGSSPG